MSEERLCAKKASDWKACEGRTGLKETIQPKAEVKRLLVVCFLEQNER